MTDEGVLGALIRAWRERSLLTQEELADRAALSARTVRRLERGELQQPPRTASVRQLAAALDLSPAERDVLIRAARTAYAPDPAAATGPVSTVDLAPAATVTVPRQLPADVSTFAGREAHRERLDALLDEHGPGGPATRPTVLVAITGTAGVGKTALAVHWAHRAADRFPDGQLFVNLRGFDAGGAAVSPADAVRGLLDALGVPSQHQPADLQAQVNLYRSVLVGRRVLVVLDNARDAEQVRPLLPGAPGCMALVTSRHHLSGLVAVEGARPLRVDVPSLAEAREVLSRRIGRRRTQAEPAAVDEILTRCARLPLALAVVAARAAANPEFRLGALAAELRGSRAALDAFASEDLTADLRAVLSWSHRMLSAPAARLFALLALHPGPDIGVAAAASLAGEPAERTGPLLAELTGAHVLSESVPGRFAFHDLLRAYAGELAPQGGPERVAAVRRLLSHYLHTAHAANLRLGFAYDPVSLPPLAPGAAVQPVTDYDSAMDWFIAEWRALAAAVGQAQAQGFAPYVWPLTSSVTTFLHVRGQLHDWARVQQAALHACRSLADRRGEACALRDLGRAHSKLGAYGRAHDHLRQALRLFESLSDESGRADTLLALSHAFEREGRCADALDEARRALALTDGEHRRAGRARALNAVGWCESLLGEHARALVHCRRALALYQELGNRLGEAHTWDSLGYIYHHLGRHERATTCFRQALELSREAGSRYYEAETLARLGDAHHAAGQLAEAGRAWRRALRIFSRVSHPDAERLRVRLRELDRG